MSTLKQAARQALEALTSRDGDGWTRRFARDRAIEALEAALAEPVQKPLTEDEIDGLVIQHAGYGQDNFYAIARAVERAHGIT